MHRQARTIHEKRLLREYAERISERIKRGAIHSLIAAVAWAFPSGLLLFGVGTMESPWVSWGIAVLLSIFYGAFFGWLIARSNARSFALRGKERWFHAVFRTGVVSSATIGVLFILVALADVPSQVGFIAAVSAACGTGFIFALVAGLAHLNQLRGAMRDSAWQQVMWVFVTASGVPLLVPVLVWSLAADALMYAVMIGGLTASVMSALGARTTRVSDSDLALPSTWRSRVAQSILLGLWVCTVLVVVYKSSQGLPPVENVQ